MASGFDGRQGRRAIAELPEPARRCLTAVIPNGAPLVTGVELEMTGRIKLGIWLSFSARQFLRAGTGLVWAAEVGGRVVRFVGADTLGPDRARMQFRFHERIPVVNASGADTDRSAAGRLAAETVAWLPAMSCHRCGSSCSTAIDDRCDCVQCGRVAQ